jgi:hypothetical protein
VRQLSQLQRLFLTETYVTDEGLQRLKRLNWLKELNLVRTKVTAQGVAGLQKALPACRIIASPEGRQKRR